MVLTTTNSDLEWLALQINRKATEAQDGFKQMLYAAKDCGQFLAQARQQVAHGAWSPWVETNCSFGLRQAQKYIRLAENWHQVELQLQNANPGSLSLNQALALVADRKEPEAIEGELVEDAHEVWWGTEAVSETESPGDRYYRLWHQTHTEKVGVSPDEWSFMHAYEQTPEGQALRETLNAGGVPLVTQSATSELQSARPKAPRLNNPNAHNEHLTPDDVKFALELQLRGQAIDLDPASNSGIPNIPARRHFTRSNDGLSNAWCNEDGSPSILYLNPPYTPDKERGTALVDWSEKFVRAYEELNHVAEAWWLVPTYNAERWWDLLMQFRPMLCAYRGRMRYGGNGNDSARFSSSILYFGPNVDRFYRAFGDLGQIWWQADEEAFGS
ncbi:MAG: DUF3102 domain-containing protein [Cyanobacteria bacterium P01_H01_bin.121]